MIIEIKDLPPGQQIRSIDCKIYFDPVGVTTVETKVSPTPVVTPKAPVNTQDRQENVAAEMLDAEF